MINIRILGNPKPQPRHRHFRRGSFSGTYDPAKNDKASFLQIVLEHAPEKPFTCGLCVDLDFYFSRPKNHYGTGKNKNKLKSSAPVNHTTRPDIDNLRKFVMDAMNKVFWRDDSIICEGHTRKMFSGTPRTEIAVKLVAQKKSPLE